MFALLLRDGSRTKIEAPDLWEAMRIALRLDATQLEVPGAPPRLMTAEQVRRELALDRPGLFDEYTPDWQACPAAKPACWSGSNSARFASGPAVRARCPMRCGGC